MPTYIAGWVMRSRFPDLTALFYRDLGLLVKETTHNSSPLHHELGPLTEAVVEIYPFSAHAGDTLLVCVPSIVDALAVTERFGLSVETKVNERKGYLFIPILDPDGRNVLLIEKKTAP